MEVHSHTHTPRKKWNHYFWEFMMLFLAVFCGFWAENQREHFIEHKREKKFIESMIADLKDDIHQLDSVRKRREFKLVMIDSMLWILEQPNPDQYGNQLYYYARWIPRPNRVINNDGTILQLKNAGNLRLIRSHTAVKSIMEYDQEVRAWLTVEDREETLILQYYPSLKTMFDARVFDKMVTGIGIARPQGNPRLLIRDKPHIDELYSHIHFLKNTNTYQMEMGDRRARMAKKVLEVFKKEYKLE